MSYRDIQESVSMKMGDVYRQVLQLQTQKCHVPIDGFCAEIELWFVGWIVECNCRDIVSDEAVELTTDAIYIPEMPTTAIVCLAAGHYKRQNRNDA